MSITLSNICKAYGERRVLRGVTLDIPQGVTCLMGPSGCGKTTLINLLMRFFELNGGSIRIQSELGKGSRFEVDLTFAIDKEAKPETEIKSVLLITREEQLIRNVKAAFKESDMELSAAASVEQAQTLLEEHPVQAIVLNGFAKK